MNSKAWIIQLTWTHFSVKWNPSLWWKEATTYNSSDWWTKSYKLSNQNNPWGLTRFKSHERKANSLQLWEKVELLYSQERPQKRRIQYMENPQHQVYIISKSGLMNNSNKFSRLMKMLLLRQIILSRGLTISQMVIRRLPHVNERKEANLGVLCSKIIMVALIVLSMIP